MEALRKLENQERKNFEHLEEIGEQAQIKFGRIYRFGLLAVDLILFAAYFTLRSVFRIGFLLFSTPRLVQQVGPGERPLEKHEFEKSELRLPR